MNNTRLTKTDLAAIEERVKHEMTALPPEPTLDTLRAEGYRENRALNTALDMIASTGRVLTLVIAESIQAIAAVLIAVVFAILEYYRVWHGAEALGQPPDQATLIAVAVVVANIVHPIYSLRALKGQGEIEIQRQTLRGWIEAFGRRLFGRPVVRREDAMHNPTLHAAAAVITWSTVLLAVYDILGPLLTQLVTGNLVRPLPIMLMELVMGLGLSIAGVFFLQSAAHEIGVRTLTDQPERLADRLAERKAQHQAAIADLRERITQEHIEGKLADAERQEAAKQTPPLGSALASGNPPSAADPARAQENDHVNGAGKP